MQAGALSVSHMDTFSVDLVRFGSSQNVLRKIIHLKYLHGNKAVGLFGKVVRAQIYRLIAVTELQESVKDKQKGIDSNWCRQSR